MMGGGLVPLVKLITVRNWCSVMKKMVEESQEKREREKETERSLVVFEMMKIVDTEFLRVTTMMKITIKTGESMTDRKVQKEVQDQETHGQHKECLVHQELSDQCLSGVSRMKRCQLQCRELGNVEKRKRRKWKQKEELLQQRN